MQFPKFIPLLSDTGNTKKDIFYFLNAIVLLLLSTYIFFAPFPTSAVNEITFYSSFALVVFLIILRKTDFSFKTPLLLPFTIFVVWSAIGIFFAINKENSSHDVYVHLIKYIIVYFMLVNYFNSPKKFIALTWIIIISAAIFSYGGIVYFYLLKGYNIHTRFTCPEYVGLRDFIYVFATILAVYLLSTNIKLVYKIILVFCIVGTIAATFLTQTRNALIALVIALIVLSYKNKEKKKLLIAVIFFCFLSVITLNKLGNRFSISDLISSKITRVSNNILYIEMIKNYPVTGIGFGMQTYQSAKLLNIYNQRVPDKYKQDIPIEAPHNLLIDISVRLGIPGLIFFLYIIFTFLRMGWTTVMRGRHNFIRGWGLCITAAFTAFFFSGMFVDVEFGLPAIIQYAILAMMTILWQLNAKSDIKLQLAEDNPFH